MTREQLIASLTAHAPGGWWPSPDDDTRYIDWSVRNPDGSYQVEVGAGADAVQMEVTRGELVELHRALTITLLADH